MSAFVALKGSFTLRGVMWDTAMMLTMCFRVSKVTYETKISVDTYLKYMTTEDSKSNNKKNKTLAWSLKDSMGRASFSETSLQRVLSTSETSMSASEQSSSHGFWELR